METSEAVMNNKKCGPRSEPGTPKSVPRVPRCICDANGSEILTQVMLILMSAPQISLPDSKEQEGS